MILVVLYVVFKSKPPVGEAVAGIASFDQAPDLVLPLITLLGGSCGGYIASQEPTDFWTQVQGREGSPEGAPVRAHGRRRIRNHENSAVPGSSRRSHSHA